MAKIEYRPRSIEFYAPDSFERGELSITTTSSDAVAAKGDYVLASNCDEIVTLGLNGVDTVRGRVGELEEKVKDLALAIDKIKESAGKGLKKGRMSKLRAELRTLCY